MFLVFYGFIPLEKVKDIWDLLVFMHEAFWSQKYSFDADFDDSHSSTHSLNDDIVAWEGISNKDIGLLMRFEVSWPSVLEVAVYQNLAFCGVNFIK